ncbi:hypothetical protein ACFL1G_02910 [Planctomycetota bacterium]
MRPETQIRIARITALIIVIHLLISPLLMLNDKLQTEGAEITLTMATQFLIITYLMWLPLIAILGGYAWALKRRKFKLAIILFIIHTLSGVYRISGVVLLFGVVPFAILLLQGLLGIRKLNKTLDGFKDEQKQQANGNC